MTSVEDRLDVIEARNARVDNDKRWETSLVRRLAIAAITFITATAYLLVVGASRALIAALVPTGGFVLSTLTLPLLKREWLARWR